MLMSASVKPVMVVVGLVAAYVLGAAVQWPLGTRHNDGTVKVSGSGSVSATPDQMVLGLTVRSKRPTTAGALDAASGSMAKIIAKAEQLGIAKADLRTDQIRVEPDTTYSSKAGEQVRGYFGVQSLKVTVRDLAKAGDVLPELVGAGGDDVRLDQTVLKVTNKNAALDEARTKAIKSAQAKATQYAEATGRSLGTVLKIVEYGGTSVTTASYDTSDGALKSVPIEPGEQKIKVTVTATWRLN